MKKLSFEYYKIPDQLDNASGLADELVQLASHPERLPKLIKDTYSESMFDSYNLQQVVDTMKLLTYQNAKIVIRSKNIFELE